MENESLNQKHLNSHSSMDPFKFSKNLNCDLNEEKINLEMNKGKEKAKMLLKNFITLYDEKIKTVNEKYIHQIKSLYLKYKNSLNRKNKNEKKNYNIFLINLEKKKTNLIEEYLSNLKIKTIEESELNDLVQKQNKMNKNGCINSLKDISNLIDNKERDAVNVMKKQINQKTDFYLVSLEEKLEKEKSCYKSKMELRIKEKKSKINQKMSMLCKKFSNKKKNFELEFNKMKNKIVSKINDQNYQQAIFLMHEYLLNHEIEKGNDNKIKQNKNKNYLSKNFKEKESLILNWEEIGKAISL